MSTNGNRVIGGFEDAIEKGQSFAGKTVKQAASDFGNTVRGQLGGTTGQNSIQSDQGTNEQGNLSQKKMSDDQAKQFLKDLYGPTTKKTSNIQKPVEHPIGEALGLSQVDPNAGKTPEEIAKIQSLRSQLHQDYYQNLVNPPKSQEKPVVEKLEEEEKMEELEEAKKKEKAPGPLQNVKTGTGEKMIGVSG